MSTATLETTDRAEWLEWRRGGIGASDTPAIMGQSSRHSPLDIYLDKIGEKEEDDEASLEQEIGLYMEPWLKSKYETLTGRKIVSTQQWAAHPVIGYLQATLDGVTECGRVVEYKTTSSYVKAKEIGDEGTDEIPSDWMLQLHHQMLVAQVKIADIVILQSNRKLTIHTVECDPALGEIILDRLADFWSRVQARNPPPATRGSDCRVLAKLYPEAEGEIEFNRVQQAEVAAFEHYGAEVRRLEKERESSKAVILACMKDAAVARLPDGRILKRSVVHVKERTQHVKASTQTRLTISKGESR